MSSAANDADVPSPRLPAEPGWLTVDDGTRLWVEVDGPECPALTLVFVHGFTLSIASYRKQREALEDSAYRRVFYDQRAFGLSDRGPRSQPSLRRLAADLAGLLDTIDGPVVLIGHSMGGMVISALAGLRPELFGAKVRGNVLIATTATGRDIGLFGLEAIVHRFGVGVMQQLHRGRPVIRLAGRLPFDLVVWLFHDPRAARANRRAMAEIVAQNRFDVMGDYLGAMLEYDELQALSQLGEVPTIVVAGRADRITPLAANERVAAAIPGAEIIVADRAGHMVTFERPDVVNEAIASVARRALPS